MKNTPLFDEHKNTNAKMIDFSGWMMPVQYTSIIKEHKNTRTNASLFDICHMGEFYISGKEALPFLQNLVSGDLANIQIGKAKYVLLLNENGGTIDDTIVFHTDENEYLMVVNAGNIDKDFNWLLENKNDYDVTLKNESDNIAKIDIQGPKSEKIISSVTKDTLPKRFHFINTKINDIDVILSRTGYTGEDGFELFINTYQASKMWNYLLEQGKNDGLAPAGLGARDSLRLEACYPLYGHELTDEITPYEAGLNFTVSMNKSFTGKEKLAKQKEKGISQKLLAIEMNEKAIPREGYEIYKDNEKIGFITSGTFSPTFNKGIAMGYIAANKCEIGSEVQIKIRNKFYKATIKKKPLYEFKGGK